MMRKVAALVIAFTCLLTVGVRAEVKPGWKFPEVKSEPNPLHIQGPAGEYFTFSKTCVSTKGNYTLAYALIPPGAGPLPHVHHRTDEWFYFPEGGITLEMGEHEYPTIGFIPGATAPKDTFTLVKTKPGDLYYGPRDIIHGFFNDTKVRHPLIFVWAPSEGIEQYFNEVGQHVGSDPNHLPPIAQKNKALFISQGPKYGINQSSKYTQYISKVDYSHTMTRLDPRRDELEQLLTTDYSTRTQAPSQIPCK